MYEPEDEAFDAWAEANPEAYAELVAGDAYRMELMGVPSHTALLRRHDETVHINAYSASRTVVLNYPPVQIAENAYHPGVVRELPVATVADLAGKYAAEVNRHIAEHWVLAHSTAAR
jgi:hypothetical protein